VSLLTNQSTAYQVQPLLVSPQELENSDTKTSIQQQNYALETHEPPSLKQMQTPEQRATANIPEGII